MRRSRIAAISLLALSAGGCGVVDDWAGWRQRPTPPALVSPTESEIVKDYLDLMAQLGSGAPAIQAELTEAARTRFTQDPTSANKLRYAIALATPGYPGANAQDSRILLGEVLASHDALLPGEVTIATIVYREVNARLALEAENSALRVAVDRAETERTTAADRRLQAQLAEIARLRKELDAAQAKLEAVAELEKALLERQPGKSGMP
jgi:hypothetical protein